MSIKVKFKEAGSGKIIQLDALSVVKTSSYAGTGPSQIIPFSESSPTTIWVVDEKSKSVKSYCIDETGEAVFNKIMGVREGQKSQGFNLR